MMKIKMTDDSFWTIPACDGERRTFKTIKTRDMWKRLHQKKCECCRNYQKENPNTNIGWTETTYNGDDRSSFLAHREDLQAQEEVNRAIHRLIQNA